MALNIALACASSALAADMPAIAATAAAASKAVQILARLPIPDKGCIVFSVITALPPCAWFLARTSNRFLIGIKKNCGPSAGEFQSPRTTTHLAPAWLAGVANTTNPLHARTACQVRNFGCLVIRSHGHGHPQRVAISAGRR